MICVLLSFYRIVNGMDKVVIRCDKYKYCVLSICKEEYIMYRYLYYFFIEIFLVICVLCSYN